MGLTREKSVLRLRENTEKTHNDGTLLCNGKVRQFLNIKSRMGGIRFICVWGANCLPPLAFPFPSPLLSPPLWQALASLKLFWNYR
jgi:hypothetical protein